MNNEATPAESKPKHTELPWSRHYGYIYGPDNVCLGEIFGKCNGRLIPEAAANINFIVRACNSHYELLEAAREALCEINKRDVDDVNRELQDKGLPDKLNVYDLNLLDRRSKAGWKLEAAIAKAEPEGEGQ